MNTDCTQIRAARLMDANSLATAHEASWRYAYSGVLPTVELERYIANHGSLWWQRYLMRDPDILVLNFEDTVIGYATIGENRNHAFPYHGEIMELYIHPDYHGLGFGSRLFRIARKQLRRYGFRGLFIWTLADNDTAIEFYTNMGGQIVAKTEGLFGTARIKKVGFGWED